MALQIFWLRLCSNMTVFIVGDFNIHVCCSKKPMVKGFLNINVVQFVLVYTQELGHTLNLVLSNALPVVFPCLVIIIK